MAEERTFSLFEVAKHSKRGDCWMVIHEKVYDVTPFLEDHPGGEDILVETSGRDATREFEDVGHSTNARKSLDQLFIGKLGEPTEEEKAEHAKNISTGKTSSIITEKDQSTVMQSIARYLVPILIIGLGLLIRRYTSNPADP